MADKQKLTREQAENVLTLARERYESSCTADKDARDEALTDLKFRSGEQWPEDLKNEREEAGRPCLVIDKINEKVRQVIGDHRQNRQQIKVNPVDDDADTDTADVISGLIRNIEYISHSPSVYTTGLESAVSCGRGFWRIVTRYANDDDFDQEAYLERIANVFSVHWDGLCQDLFFRDARYIFVSQVIGREEYRQKYKDFEPVNFDADKDMSHIGRWIEGDAQRIAEYWLKVPDPDNSKVLYLVNHGKHPDTGEDVLEIEDKKPRDTSMIVKQREVRAEKIIFYKIDGKNILEGPHDWVSRKYYPIVPVWGEEINIEGERFTRGLVRLARDPQKMLNYFESMVTESISLAPKVPYILTATQLGKHKQYWDRANTTLPYLLYDGDSEANGPPQRQRPAMIPQAYERRSEMNAEHIKSATSIYNASLGAASNETSGKAILARQKEGDVGTFTFLDNLNWSIRHTGTILVDIIPRIYDTAQVRRIIGEDGEHKRIRIANAGSGHQEYTGDKGEGERIYDLSVGKYDVAVTAGPSFTTKRQEAAQAQMELVKAVPEIMQFIGDNMVRSMDWPNAEDAAERLKYYLHPAIQAKLAAEEDTEKGGQASPEVAHAMRTAVGGGLPAEDQQAAAQEQVDPATEVKLEQERVKLEKMKFEAEQAKYQMQEARHRLEAAGVKLEEEKVKLADGYAQAGIDPDQAEQELAPQEAAV